MKPLVRTLMFVVAAILFVGGAAYTWHITRPADIADYDGVGEPFFPNFTDTELADHIRVAGWNNDSEEIEVFSVRKDSDGLWRIPSHFNYPADGQDQMVQAATTLLGIERSAFVSSGNSEANRNYGLVDPLDEDGSIIQSQEETGTRVTLYEGDRVLADYIIGKPKEDDDYTNLNNAGRREMQGRFYLRRADERQIYTSQINLRLSTRFSDWIRSELLEVRRSEIASMTIDDYTFDSATQRIVPVEPIAFISEGDPPLWDVADLKEGETARQFIPGALAKALEDLSIQNVKPRKVQFTGDRFLPTQETITSDAENGFFHNVEQGDVAAVRGEYRFSTNDGLRYTIHFGDANSQATLDGSSVATTGDVALETEATAVGDVNNTMQRTVLVAVSFDPSLLGPAPVAPQRPAATDTAGNSEAVSETPERENDAAEKTETPTESDAETEPMAKPATEGASDASTEPATETDEAPSIDDAEKDKAENKVLTEQEFEEALEIYQLQKKEYDERAANAVSRAGELNFKFAQWYYVVRETDVKNLMLTRPEVVQSPMPTTTPADSPQPE